VTQRFCPLFFRAVFLAILGVVWLALPVIQSATMPALNWYKGNLHTHTINSDGDSSPDAVARWYKEHRYNFLVLTDHNFLTTADGLNSIFAAREKFLLIPGEEVTSKFEAKPIHVNAFRVPETIPPEFGNSVIDTIQRNVDTIRSHRALPSLNHPNFGWAVTPEELSQVNNLKLFEVYNGHPGVNNIGGGDSDGLEAMWDVVLTAGRETYGIAVDDAHSFKEFRPDLSNPGRGWVAVRAAELTTDSIMTALDTGEFYASTGVELEEMSRQGGTLSLKIKEKRPFKYTTEFVGQGGKTLAKSIELAASHTLQPGEKYVRATVTASDGSKAWVQPVFAK
jgi:hypothetical protein